MRAAIYSRVSTTDQHPEVQLEPMRKYCEARGLEITREYVDHGVSGSKASRPALNELLADAKLRKFDLICIVKLDRLARSVSHLVRVAGDLEALGVDLVVLDQSIDTSTPSGRLLFHVIGSIAEFETDLIKTRVRSGLAAAKKRGVRLGRRRALVGSDTYKLERLVAQGLSNRAIAKELGVSHPTVASAKKRLGLTG